MMDLDNILSCI